ncbi:MAG: hypothetical protein RSC56_04775 [Acidaminococcaceae bacterium]
MDYTQYQAAITTYLEKETYINLKITREEVTSEATARYFALLECLGRSASYVEKFRERLVIHFSDYTEEELFTDTEIKKLINRFNAEFPYLFFFLDKSMGTIKLFTIVECGTGTSDGEHFALDKAKFNAYVQYQCKGIIKLAQYYKLEPELAETVIQNVYNYFGLPGETKQ